MLALMLSLTVAGSPVARYVVADVANVRAEPNEKAALVARFRINTVLLLEPPTGEWIQIHPAWEDSSETAVLVVIDETGKIQKLTIGLDGGGC